MGRFLVFSPQKTAGLHVSCQILKMIAMLEVYQPLSIRTL
jgi:hypothetical protein